MLKQILLTQMRERGPMPFEEFQAAALYDPEHGFFSRGELRSTKAGDFLTSPEVSPLFGETLARFVEKEMERIWAGGLPPSTAGSSRRPLPGTRGETTTSFHLVEVGAGSGSLLKPLLAKLSFAPEVWAIEASPMARNALLDLIPLPLAGEVARSCCCGAEGAEPDTDRTLDRGVGEQPPLPLAGHSPHHAVGGEHGPHILTSIDELPGHLTGVILANELIDNLPVAIAVRAEDGWRERWVGVDGDDLALVDAPARPEVVDWCDRFAGPCPVDGYVEVQLLAAHWLRTALAKLDSGAVLLVDYGDTAENLEPRRTEGTLRTYRAHHLGPHPLDEPGDTDITVDVNFTALQTIARESGATVEYHRQDDFLASLGLRDELSQLRRDELALARDGDPLERLKIRSLKNEVETLLHPRGLGDFRVLVARIT